MSVGQEASCQGMIEKIKDGGVKTFSFIAGEGASQLARLSGTGHYSSFNRSVSDSQHKSLLSKMALCVCVLWERMRVHVAAQRGAISQPASQPAQPRIQMNSRKLQRWPWLIGM